MIKVSKYLWFLLLKYLCFHLRLIILSHGLQKYVFYRFKNAPQMGFIFNQINKLTIYEHILISKNTNTNNGPTIF